MHKKSFTFGIGTGILAVTLVFYFVYNAQILKYRESFDKELAAQKEQLQSEFSEPEPQVREVTAELTDSEIMLRAEQLGMVFKEQVPDDNADSAVKEEPPEPLGLTDEDAFVTVEIASGKASSEIADILYQSGVVDNAASFDEFLIGTGNAKKIASGKFTIPKNLTYEEVLAIIRVK